MAGVFVAQGVRPVRRVWREAEPEEWDVGTFAFIAQLFSAERAGGAASVEHAQSRRGFAGCSQVALRWPERSLRRSRLLQVARFGHPPQPAGQRTGEKLTRPLHPLLHIPHHSPPIPWDPDHPGPSRTIPRQVVANPSFCTQNDVKIAYSREWREHFCVF